MSTIKIADIVAAIPFGTEGKKRYRTVGALLKHSINDSSKGPGFTISLDAFFNPAGCPINHDGTVYLSCYNPKLSDEGPARRPETPIRRPALPAFDGSDDDIPF
jgi:single-strand DNA-binding protein